MNKLSKLVNIKSVERIIKLSTYQYLKKEKTLKQYKDGRGYLHVKLYDGKGKPKSLTVHRIVALTFINNPNEYEEVNHIDHNKTNNNISNFNTN